MRSTIASMVLLIGLGLVVYGMHCISASAALILAGLILTIASINLVRGNKK